MDKEPQKREEKIKFEKRVANGEVMPFTLFKNAYFLKLGYREI